MSAANDLNPLKRKVLLAYHRDGILDLTVGSVILGFGLNMLTDNIVFLMLGWLMMLLYVFLKQRITIPRFGYVRIESPEKNWRQLRFLLGLGVLVLLLFLIGMGFRLLTPTSPEWQAWMQQYHMVPLSALLFGLPALIAAMVLGLRRFYLYALLAAALPAAGAWLTLPTFLPILITGLVILAFGIVLLVTFLTQYPLSDTAGSYDA